MPWQESEKDEVIKALAVACEVTSTTLSPAARSFVLAELEGHPAGRVLNAIRQAARACTGRITLAHIVGELDKVDRKAISDQAHARLHEETLLRSLALTERIPWESGKEAVRAELLKRGYKLAPIPEKPKEIRQIRHWQDDEKSE